MAITNNTKMFTGIKTIIYCYNYLRYFKTNKMFTSIKTIIYNVTITYGILIINNTKHWTVPYHLY